MTQSTSNGGRMPPHSLDVEAAVLSAVFLDATGARLDEVRTVVRPETFYSRAHGIIFEAVCALADRGGQIDVVTVLQMLRDQGRAEQVGGAAYLAQLVDATPAIANVQEHARILREHHRVRQTVHLAQRIAAEGYSTIGTDPAGVQKWLEGCEASIADLVHVHEERTLAPMPVVMDETAAMLDAIKSGGAAGVPSGFTEVDAQTSGLHDGDFYIIAARPGMGKSAYALSMAARMAAAGYAVPFFSIEMPRVQLGARLVAMDARVDLKRMREQSFPPSERQKADASMKLLRDLPLFIDDSAVLTPLDIKARVKRIQREVAGGKHPNVTTGRIGAAFIDYLQLVRPTRDTHSREQDVASIGRDLKILSKVLGIPIIALCQLNREVEKRVEKRPQLSDLRESGAIEQEADAIQFIYRPSYYDRGKNPDPALKGWAEIIVAKQRNGPTGTRRVAFREDCTRFDNLQPGDVGIYDDKDAEVRRDWHSDDDFEEDM